MVGHGAEHKRAATRRVLAFLAAAVVVHLVALSALDRLFPSPAASASRRVRMVARAPSSKMLAQGMQPPVARRVPVVPKREDDDKLTGQVVDLPPTADSTPPENARFLSEHNTRTEHETRSRHQSADYRNAMNEVTVKQQTADASRQPSPSTRSGAAGAQTAAKRAAGRPQGTERVFELPDATKHDRLALRLDEKFGQLRNRSASDRLQGNSSRLKLALGDEDADQATERQSAPAPGAPAVNLVPPAGILAQLSGAPPNDHLGDLDEGEGTFLNSREFKYASFFNRVKRDLSANWHPWQEYGRRDPTGNIYGLRERVTVLNVTLNTDGSLKGTTVKQSSGLDFLDREAQAAFQRAEPFPNPPKGLVNSSGEVSFLFGFYLELSSRAAPLPF